MDNVLLQALRGAVSEREKRQILTKACMPYGDVMEIEILTLDDTVLCFVQMESFGQNAAVCRGLGGFPYGFRVGFRVPRNKLRES